MMFHGTALSNLHSIIRQGLSSSDDEEDSTYGGGVFMVLEPSTSISYSWLKIPSCATGLYGSWGLLIGCEVTDDGNPFTVGHEGDPHEIIVERLEAVMPR